MQGSFVHIDASNCPTDRYVPIDTRSGNARTLDLAIVAHALTTLSYLNVTTFGVPQLLSSMADVQPRPATWLAEALDEIEQAPEEATEEGYASIPSEVLARARTLLQELSRWIAQVPMIHPTAEGGIAIDFQNASGTARAILICEPGGDIVCLYRRPEAQGYERAADPTRFVSTLRDCGLLR